MNITKIISGGQTGADMGGLLAAKELGISTGGNIPKGFLTENGSKPELAEYGLLETKSSNYPERTMLNVQQSDVTLIFSTEKNSRGTELTKKLCLAEKKPFMLISSELNRFDVEFGIKEFLMEHNAKVVNIAGNRESKSPGIEQRVKSILIDVVRELK